MCSLRQIHVKSWLIGGMLLGLVLCGCAPAPSKSRAAKGNPPGQPPPPPAKTAPAPPPPPPAAPSVTAPATVAPAAGVIATSPAAAANPPAKKPAEVEVAPVSDGQPPAITVARGAVGDLPPGLKGTSIQARQGEKFIWGPYPSTCVAVLKDGEEAQVWDVAAGKQVGRKLTGLVKASKFALSPDGKRLALLAVVDKQTGVGIWSTETGKSAANFQYADKAQYTDWLTFAGPDHLLIVTPTSDSSPIEVWDAAAGKRLAKIAGPAFVREDHIAASPDGTALAAFHSLGKNRVTLYDIATGNIKTELPAPGISSCEGLAYSPGGEELAGLFGTGSDNTLVSWAPDKRQQVFRWTSGSVSKMGIKGASGYPGANLEWLPDRSGFLLFGHYVVDRQSQRVVWTIEAAEGEYVSAARRLVDNDRLAVVTGPSSGLRRIQLALIPWMRINASLAVLAADGPALLKPGQTASLEIEMGELRGGTVEATRDVLAEAIAEALAERHIDLADDAPVVLVMKYREEKGEELEEIARTGGPGGILPPIPGPGATGTGRKIIATQIHCDLALRRADKPTVLWSSSVDFDPQYLSIRGDFSDAAARESSLKMAAHSLARQSFPYFIPAGEGATSLPGVTKLPGAGNRAGVKVKSSRK